MSAEAEPKTAIACGFTEHGAIYVQIGESGGALTHAQALHLADGLTTLVAGLRKQGVEPKAIRPLSDDPIRMMFKPGVQH